LLSKAGGDQPIGGTRVHKVEGTGPLGSCAYAASTHTHGKRPHHW